jgi:hypothetical protein
VNQIIPKRLFEVTVMGLVLASPVVCRAQTDTPAQKSSNPMHQSSKQPNQASKQAEIKPTPICDNCIPRVDPCITNPDTCRKKPKSSVGPLDQVDRIPRIPQ